MPESALAVVELDTGLAVAGVDMCGAAPSFERFIGGSVDLRRVLGDVSRFVPFVWAVGVDVEEERGFVVLEDVEESSEASTT